MSTVWVWSGNAAEVGPYLLERLTEAMGAHPNVAEVRGVGLMAAVEFMDDPDSRNVVPADDGRPADLPAMLSAA